jgi:hypothetical protein
MDELNEFVQKECIIAAHNMAFDDAIREELTDGCRIIIKPRNWDEKYKFETVLREKYVYNGGRSVISKGGDFELIKIIGQPCTLSRILNALRRVKFAKSFIAADTGEIYRIDPDNLEVNNRAIKAKWIYTKDNGKEALFEDQLGDTQIKIARLLEYNK